jgi:hypothetical protein
LGLGGPSVMGVLQQYLRQNRGGTNEAFVVPLGILQTPQRKDDKSLCWTL